MEIRNSSLGFVFFSFIEENYITTSNYIQNRSGTNKIFNLRINKTINSFT